ncbi:MAG: YfhO family protein [Anaerolineae bacterium]|nr:YfhO family protein [Anaerolineae bacterium]
MNQPTNRSLFWIIALFALLPILAFPEIIFGRQTLYWSDLSWMHYPRHIFAANEWLAGRVPLWDPYQHNGLPFLAETQVGALYLFSVIFLSPLSPSLELSLFIVLHFSLASAFTFILVRSLGLSLMPSVLAGLAFGMGGFLMAQVSNLNIMTGATWLPLILYGIIRAGRERSWLSAMLAGIPLALQIFTAQPQVVFYTLVTVGGYAIYRIVADWFTPSQASKPRLHYAIQTMGLVIVTILTGLLLAAPQLLPTLELQQLSVRSEEQDFGFLVKNSLPPLMWLNLVLPSAFGNNVTGFEGGDPFQEDFIYIGLIPLLLIPLSFSRPLRRDTVFWVLLIIGGAILAMGRYTPLYEDVIQYLPGFALFRIPARWLMVVNLALAVLAGYGLENLLNAPKSRTKAAALVVSGLGVAVGLSLAWIFRENLIDWTRGGWSDTSRKLLRVFFEKGFTLETGYQNRLLLGWIYWITTPIVLTIVNIVLTTAIFGLYALNRFSTATLGRLVVAAVAIDLVIAGGTTVNPTQPDSWWHQLSGGAEYVLEHIDGTRVFPLGMGSEQATVSQLGQYFPSVYRVRSAGGHGSSLMLERTQVFMGDAHPVQAIRALGVRYLLTEGLMGADAASTYPIAYSDANSFVYENKTPLPRAFVVHDAIQVDTPEDAMAYFETVAVDPSQTVVLETNGNAPHPAAASTPSRAEIIHENPLEVDIEVKAAADGYLVLLDTIYPGWVATVDGQRQTIYAANYISRAVFVPQGQHTVQFSYRPLTFRVGIWLSAIALLIMAVMGVIDNQNMLSSYKSSWTKTRAYDKLVINKNLRL